MFSCYLCTLSGVVNLAYCTVFPKKCCSSAIRDATSDHQRNIAP
uniref:Uncharacterized protein n=1 Tax=Rhizophora mucronata TaxID=61149 RepID=A0A2P2R209_RHIMU